jgi:hypothetical protein
LWFESEYEAAEYVAKRPKLLKIAIQMAQYEEGVELEEEMTVVASSTTEKHNVLDQKVKRLFINVYLLCEHVMILIYKRL